MSLALEAAKLAPAKSVRIVSMPCREAFLRQSEQYQAELLPKTAKIVVAEAGIAQGWGDIAQRANIFSIDRFGASGPAGEGAKHLGFTAERLAEIVEK